MLRDNANLSILVYITNDLLTYFNISYFYNVRKHISMYFHCALTQYVSLTHQ